jgi:hypothetical protein
VSAVLPSVLVPVVAVAVAVEVEVGVEVEVEVEVEVAVAVEVEVAVGVGVEVGVCIPPTAGACDTAMSNVSPASSGCGSAIRTGSSRCGHRPKLATRTAPCTANEAPMNHTRLTFSL